jgi:hypothetical protein
LPVSTLLKVQQALRTPMATDWKSLIEECAAAPSTS